MVFRSVGGEESFECLVESNKESEERSGGAMECPRSEGKENVTLFVHPYIPASLQPTILASMEGNTP